MRPLAGSPFSVLIVLAGKHKLHLLSGPMLSYMSESHYGSIGIPPT